MSTTSTTSRTADRGARHALTALALALATLLMPLSAPTAHADEDATPAPRLDQTASPPPDTRTTKDPHIESAPAAMGCITGVHEDEVNSNSAQFTITTNTAAFITLVVFPSYLWSRCLRGDECAEHDLDAAT